MRISASITSGVLEVSVTQIILDQTQIITPVGQGVATAMSEHVQMDGEAQADALGRRSNHVIDRETAPNLTQLILGDEVPRPFVGVNWSRLP